ncbi:hypothetical protein [Actinomadura chokoriensis]|uniref:hypothetical protein n=1 Tax=Actinomadura chokoriensis TaxID=454156 RepID=UPI0031F84D9E
MAVPIDDETRKRVLEEARAGASRNEVARRTGVSTASVSRICKAAGHTFDRTKTIKATAARLVDLKAMRVSLSGDLLGDVGEARARMHDSDSARDFFHLARSVAALTHAHVMLVRHDGDDPGLEAAKSVLGNLMDALRISHTGEDFTQGGNGGEAT